MDYPTRTRTGDAVIDRLVLTGWGTVTANVTSLFTWTDNGRLWWSYVASTGVITFYRRNSTTISGDAVCSGTVGATGLVTLTASNTSGITGSAEVTDGDYTAGALVAPTEDSTGDVIVSYCDENDLIDAAQAIPGILDSSSKYFGQLTRFEAALLRHRQTFDTYVKNNLAGIATYDNRNNVVLCDIRNPRQLAQSFAMYVVSKLLAQSFGEEHPKTIAHRHEALQLLKLLNIELDYDAERVVQKTANMSTGKLIRG